MLFTETPDVIAARGRAVAVVMSGPSVALAAGVPAGTALGTLLGWRWVFAGSAVLLLLLAAAVARLLPATPPAAGRQTVLAALRQPRLLLIAAVIALFMIGHFTVYTYISPLLLYVGVNKVGVSAVLLGYGAAGLLGLALAGSVADRHPRDALSLTMGLMAACLAGLWLGHAAAPTVIIVVIWGMTYGAVPTLTQSSALAAVPAAPDAGPAVVDAMTNVGISGGALIGARQLAVGPAPALALTGAVLVAAALLLHAVPFPRAVPAAPPGRHVGRRLGHVQRQPRRRLHLFQPQVDEREDNGSPGWAADQGRFLLADCTSGKLDSLPWPHRNRTKQRVARQPQPAQASLLEGAVDEEVAGLEAGDRGVTVVCAHRRLRPLMRQDRRIAGRCRRCRLDS